MANIKLVSQPESYYRDSRNHIHEQELEISKKIAQLVYDLNPHIFKEVWISFFSGIIHWYACDPDKYYKEHSFYFILDDAGGN